MQPVEKKKQMKGRPGLRIWLLAAGVLVLAGLITAVVLMRQPQTATSSGSSSEYGELVTKESADVASVSVTLRSGETWKLVRNEAGDMAIENEPDFKLDSAMVTNVLDAARVISYDEVLSEDPTEYRDRLAEFGLETPRCVAVFTYTDGTSQTIRIGDTGDELESSSFYYMTVDGHAGLYALDKSTAEALSVQKQSLHAVDQPVIHKVRIDRITFTSGEQVLSWELDGSISDTDSDDRWMLVQPMRYPAEGETITNLRTNLSNLRMGAYICEATAQNLTAYGFDSPRFIIEVHMAAGTIGLTDSDGVYSPTDFPESTVTITVGAEKSDVVDYVLFDGCIYTTSHYSLNTLMETTAAGTVTRYPVRVTLSNLSTLTVSTAEGDTVWKVTRVEKMDEEGNIQYDDDGNTEYDSSVTRNGEAFSWDVFEAAYNELLITTISGNLPDGWQQTEPAHTTFRFATVSGTEHTVELTSFDALHDAVICDGGALFYLIKGGFRWQI